MTDSLRYNDVQRRTYLEMIDRIGLSWLSVFDGNTEFYSANYWDLLTKLWRNPNPVRKTDALRFMTAIKSAHTAGKYLQEAIDDGLVKEMDNPEDARSKLVVLDEEMRRKLDRFFDDAVGEVRVTSRDIDIKGPSPQDP